VSWSEPLCKVFLVIKERDFYQILDETSRVQQKKMNLWDLLVCVNARCNDVALLGQMLAKCLA
jgi:hypothetical protein